MTKITVENENEKYVLEIPAHKEQGIREMLIELLEALDAHFDQKKR